MNTAPLDLGHDSGSLRLKIGERLRARRKSLHLSQAEIERRTGFSRCRISCLENGHAVPTIETLEKIAGALEIPLYRLFYSEGGAEPLEAAPGRNNGNSGGTTGYAGVPSELSRVMRRLNDRDRQTLLYLARRMLGSNAEGNTTRGRTTVRVGR
jgi:transcriptional regulator with XRE-family HTH domain